MDDYELKPCPHCGGQAKLVTDAPEYWVMCVNKCPETSNTKQGAVKNWNNRVEGDND